MNDLKKQINKIKKSYFSFADLRKMSDLNDNVLRVAVSRLVKSGEIMKLAKGYYSSDFARTDFEKLALEIYHPSYFSFEWALGYYGILSQKPYSLTLATTNRAKKIYIDETSIVYRHICADLFFGYALKNGILIADPEKAFLDLAYLSLNGYAVFDPEEMNLELLNKTKLKNYLKKFHSKKLEKLIKVK